MDSTDSTPEKPARAKTRSRPTVDAMQREILAATEREQVRIGYELHDGLGQHLTGLAFYAKALSERLREQHLPEVEAAEQLVDLANLAVSMTRALARGLRPVGPEENALTVALQQFVQDVSSLYRVECSFVADESILVKDADAAQHLYRIVQEAVNNGIKHGEATHITIDVSARSGGGLMLRVRNNGKPLTEAALAGKNKTEGMGMASMRYRAHVIGGRLSIHNMKTREFVGVELRVIYDAK